MICDSTLMMQEVVNYLSIRLDTRLTFCAQIQHTATEAAKVISLPRKLIAYIGGPTQSGRKLMMVIMHSILLYVSEV